MNMTCPTKELVLGDAPLLVASALVAVYYPKPAPSYTQIAILHFGSSNALAKCKLEVASIQRRPLAFSVAIPMLNIFVDSNTLLLMSKSAH
jgi:hypothetical protein